MLVILCVFAFKQKCFELKQKPGDESYITS